MGEEYYKNTNIYIYCAKRNRRFFEEYITTINKILKAKIIYSREDINNIDLTNKNNILIFMKNIPILKFEINNNKKNIFILNTEQLSKKNELNYIKEKSKNFMIIDYSRENIDIMNKNNIKNTIYFPYIYNIDEIYNLEKTNDICGISLIKSRNRQNIYNNKNIKIENIEGWGDDRDSILFKFKIILNISSAKDYNIFETIRCNRCLFNKMIIISDEKYNKKLIDYADHILFSKVEDMPKLVNEVLSNYKYYYKKLKIDNVNYKLNDHLIDRKYLILNLSNVK